MFGVLVLRVLRSPDYLPAEYLSRSLVSAFSRRVCSPNLPPPRQCMRACVSFPALPPLLEKSIFSSGTCRTASCEHKQDASPQKPLSQPHILLYSSPAAALGCCVQTMSGINEFVTSVKAGETVDIKFYGLGKGSITSEKYIRMPITEGMPVQA